MPVEVRGQKPSLFSEVKSYAEEEIETHGTITINNGSNEASFDG